MICKNCGSEILDGSKFCINCGAKIEEAVAPEEAAANVTGTVEEVQAESESQPESE